MTFSAMENKRLKAWQEICSKKDKRVGMDRCIKIALKASIETNNPWRAPEQ